MLLTPSEREEMENFVFPIFGFQEVKEFYECLKEFQKFRNGKSPSNTKIEIEIEIISEFQS